MTATRREVAVFGGGLALLILASALHLMQGALPLSPAEVVQALRGEGGAQAAAVMMQSRLPRLLAGVLSGAAFAMAGVLLQGVLLNDLVSPATLGVNAGAFAASVVAAVAFPSLGRILGTEVAFIGGMAAAALVFAASGGVSAAPVRIILAGVAVTFVFSAIAAVLQLFFEQQTAGLFFWGSGSLLQFGWQRVARATPRFALGVVLGLVVSGFSQVLQLGEETARARGQRVERVRVAGSLTGVLLAAAGISMSGPIGFLGLAVPHLLRLMGIRRQRARFLAAGIWGATLLIVADAGTRLLFSGTQEIPVGLVTTIVGAPVLIVLVSRARRAGGRP
ncbi:MAG: iron chelate uptake ABC transporter family permease subunit, partial [Spirochaetota bacterium]